MDIIERYVVQFHGLSGEWTDAETSDMLDKACMSGRDQAFTSGNDWRVVRRISTDHEISYFKAGRV